MDDHVETRVRFIGTGLQITLLGIAFARLGALGYVLVAFGTVVTLAGLV